MNYGEDFTMHTNENYNFFKEKKKTNPLVTAILICTLLIVASFATAIVYAVSSSIYENATYEPTYEKVLQTTATYKVEYLNYVADDGRDGDYIQFLVQTDINRDDTYDYECDTTSRWQDEYAHRTQTMREVCTEQISVDRYDADGEGRGITVRVEAYYDGTWSNTCYDLWREEGGCSVWWNPLSISWNEPYARCQYDGYELEGSMSKTLTADGYDDGDDEEYNMELTIKVHIMYVYRCNLVA